MMDLQQKAKIKWCIEGGENSKYYHAIINKKHNQTAVRGIKVEGEWVIRPNHVKKVFFDHFSNKFKKTLSSVVVNRIPHHKSLTEDQKVGLESPPIMEEVKKSGLVLRQ